MNPDKAICVLGVTASGAITLLLYLGTGVSDWVLQGSVIRVIAVSVLTVALFIALALLIMLVADTLIARGCREELNTIAHEYGQTKDAERFYQGLLSMRHRPLLSNERVAYAINLSTALTALGKPDEALAVLNNLTAGSNRANEIIEKQRSQGDI